MCIRDRDNGGYHGTPDAADSAENHVHENHNGHVVAKILGRGCERGEVVGVKHARWG